MGKDINAELLSSLLKRKSSYGFEEEIARRERDRRDSLSIARSSEIKHDGKPSRGILNNFNWGINPGTIWKKLKQKKK